MTATALAGVVGGPLSGALLTLNGAGGLAGWQWMFLLEGLPAVVLGFVVLRYLPNGPRDAAWLSEPERGRLEAQLAPERREASHGSGVILQILLNRSIWHFAVMYFTLVIAIYSISFWLPQILKGVSAGSDFVIGLLSAIPIHRRRDRHGVERKAFRSHG